MPQTDVQKAAEWLAAGAVGASSLVLCARMLGAKGGRTNHPLDADDFGRCERLLRDIPAWRGRIVEMAIVSPAWAGLAQLWPEITDAYWKGDYKTVGRLRDVATKRNEA